jgi:Fe-S-cluster containining protein
MALVLSQFDCRKNCQALCCKSSKYAPNGIPLLENEYEKIKERFGQERMDKIEMKFIKQHRYLPTPCPFLKKDICTIYDLRPVVCVNYPYDPSNQRDTDMVHLDSFCPESRRIVKATFLSLWKLVNNYKKMSSQIPEINDGAKMEQNLKFTNDIIPPNPGGGQ